MTSSQADATDLKRQEAAMLYSEHFSTYKVFILNNIWDDGNKHYSSWDYLIPGNQTFISSRLWIHCCRFPGASVSSVRDHPWNVGEGGRSTFQHWPSPMNKPLTRLRRRRKAFRAEDAACKWKRVSAMLALKIKDSSGLASKARRDFLLCYYLTGLLPLLCLQIHKSSLFDAYKVKTKFSFQTLLSIPLKKSRIETPHTLFF